MGASQAQFELCLASSSFLADVPSSQYSAAQDHYMKAAFKNQSQIHMIAIGITNRIRTDY
jgi:hypothetical protein